MLHSPATSNSSLPSFWGKFGKKAKEKEVMKQNQPQMTVARGRLMTLAFDEMETVRKLPDSYAELLAVARDWAQPPPDAHFFLRVPVEYASLATARLFKGDYIYLTDEDSYHIVSSDVQGLRVEIVSDSPPPADEPPPPPPPPVLEMPGEFNLELMPGQIVALETTVGARYELDMSRMEDGTVVDGQFWGKLDITHDGDIHKMEFSGTRLPESLGLSPEFMFDSRTLSKLTMATKPITAKCQLSILVPEQQYCDIILSFSPYWKLGVAWPIPEVVEGYPNKFKYFMRVHPGGALEHFESELVFTTLYYEAIPDPTLVDPNEYIAPRNSYAMSFRDFIPHLMNVLDQLGMSIHARTTFINNNMSAFAAHQNIAYRFLNSAKIAAAVDIVVTHISDCTFTRLFLIYRGLTDDEVGVFAGAGEKEANGVNWREIVGWSENSKDATMFRILEVSVLEVT